MLATKDSIGRCGRNCQCNLGSTPWSTSELQLRANAVCAFFHSLQAPMIIANSLCENAGINTATVIANPQSKLSRIVGDFQFDVKAFRVVKCVN